MQETFYDTINCLKGNLDDIQTFLLNSHTPPALPKLPRVALEAVGELSGLGQSSLGITEPSGCQSSRDPVWVPSPLTGCLWQLTPSSASGNQNFDTSGFSAWFAYMIDKLRPFSYSVIKAKRGQYSTPGTQDRLHKAGCPHGSGAPEQFSLMPLHHSPLRVEINSHRGLRDH